MLGQQVVVIFFLQHLINSLTDEIPLLLFESYWRLLFYLLRVFVLRVTFFSLFLVVDITLRYMDFIFLSVLIRYDDLTSDHQWILSRHWPSPLCPTFPRPTNITRHDRPCIHTSETLIHSPEYKYYTREKT